MKPLIYYQNIVHGGDPEFTFSLNGKSIGSEKVIPLNGIDCGTLQGNGPRSKIIIDGYQAELNITPASCRAYFGNNIASCFRTLARNINQNNVNVNFASVVKIPREELKSLSEKSKIFGCNPSNNAYNEIETKITVNPKKYLKRSCGGHIHISDNQKETVRAILKNPKKIVPVLDAIVGNLSVLLDRNPTNVERRKYYGRAGEYRQPVWGLEYRTLSNFWLQSYQLMSLILGMVRFSVLAVKQLDEEFITAISKEVPREKIIRAIQENNFDLAYENYSKLEPIILELTNNIYYYDHFPIHNYHIKEFRYFIEKGINYWFRDDPFRHWLNLPDGHGIGFESFLVNIVRKDMNNQQKIPIIQKTFKEIWV